jgi:hypothetical protein
MRLLLAILLLLMATPTGGQLMVDRDSADFPPPLPRAMSVEILAFREEVERQVDRMSSRASRGKDVVALIDTLIAKWDFFGEYIEREYGHLPNMTRNRPYWLMTTDDAADTLTDRFGYVLEEYIKANPEEKTGEVRVEWELSTARIGVPLNRIYGFQLVELARRGQVVRRDLEETYPDRLDEVYDAYLRFLWDMTQFYRQLHATWYDRHTLNVSKEDWILYRTVGLCDTMRWRVAMSFTAISIDTTIARDPMKDKFMHRLLLVDDECRDTVDFLVPLPHYRKMELELNERTEEERQRILERHQRELMERGARELGGGR